MWAIAWKYVTSAIGRYVVGAVVVAVLAHFAQVTMLHVKIDRLEIRIARQALAEAKLEGTVEDQAEAIAVIIENARTAQLNNTAIVAEREAEAELDKAASVKAQTALKVALSGYDCAAVIPGPEVQDAF